MRKMAGQIEAEEFLKNIADRLGWQEYQPEEKDVLRFFEKCSDGVASLDAAIQIIQYIQTFGRECL